MRRLAAGLFALLVITPLGAADAQPGWRRRLPPAAQAPAPPPPASSSSPQPGRHDFRARFGTELAERLLRSTDAEQRLQGVERLAAEHTREALLLIERASAPGGIAASDPRGLLLAVRALAMWPDKEHARAALAKIVRAQTLTLTPRSPTPSGDPVAEEARGAARIDLARQEAAVALAALDDARVAEDLLSIGRSGGPGWDAALRALAIHPPEAPILDGVALTTPGTVALAVEVGDLRSLDAIDGAARTSDPVLRAAAIVALGRFGDGRAATLGRAALHDPNAGVRVAAAQALVDLGTADAAGVVEGLIADAAAVRDGLKLAGRAQGDGIARAAAAVVAATGDAEMRVAAVEALGRLLSPLAVEALAKFIADPTLQGDAAFALARSPSPTALPAIGALALSPATRRLAARAYFARRFTRGARSFALDGVLASLARSPDATDRAVGVQAGVAFGDVLLAAALKDPVAQVRRAAVLGSLGGPLPAVTAMAKQLATEKDEATRALLLGALVDAGSDAPVPTLTLVDLVRGGGACAPLAALALARRADDDLAPRVDELLASNDPLLRAHVARGLAQSPKRDSVGRLAQAYAWEDDADVRRAIVEGLAESRAELANAPARVRTLELAARLDPDSVVRWTAARALHGESSARSVPARDLAWVRIVPARGARVPLGMTGTLALPDGRARVVSFDDDGYAVVPGIPSGPARLRLAPRLGAYESDSTP